MGKVMTQEDKDLLLKDLCARLPYGVKFPMMCWDEETGETVRPVTLYSINKDGYCHVSEDDYSPYIDEIKPYLFPLSSMTEEQKREVKDLISQQIKILIEQVKNDDCDINEGKYHFNNDLELDWLLKNHFDYRGLIEKGLALDATGLNIY